MLQLRGEKWPTQCMGTSPTKTIVNLNWNWDLLALEKSYCNVFYSLTQPDVKITWSCQGGPCHIILSHNT